MSGRETSLGAASTAATSEAHSGSSTDREQPPVRAPGSQLASPEMLDQLCANIEVGLEHLEEAVSFEHLKIEGTKIHQHPLAAEESLPALAEVREDL
jgi:hypothetical protein